MWKHTGAYAQFWSLIFAVRVLLPRSAGYDFGNVGGMLAIWSHLARLGPSHAKARAGTLQRFSPQELRRSAGLTQ